MEEERNNVRFVEWILGKVQIAVVDGEYQVAILDLKLAARKIGAMRAAKRKAERRDERDDDTASGSREMAGRD